MVDLITTYRSNTITESNANIHIAKALGIKKRKLCVYENEEEKNEYGDRIEEKEFYAYPDWVHELFNNPPSDILPNFIELFKEISQFKKSKNIDFPLDVKTKLV